MTTIKECGRIYQRQECCAKSRGIPWEFEFYEWLAVWTESGKWEQRGRRMGQYVMARFGDVGPYSVDNVKIILSSENHREATHGGWKGSCLGDLPNGKEIMAQLDASFRKSVFETIERCASGLAHMKPQEKQVA